MQNNRKNIPMKHILIFVTSLLLSLPVMSRKVTFHLEEYGVKPGIQTTSAQLNEALSRIRKESKPDDQIILNFTKGRYDFHSTDAVSREYYISNHDQDQPKLIGICLENWKNLTLDGNGSDFIFHGRMLPLALINSENCRLQNFSIDFEQPHIAQVEVVANSETEGITFRVAPWVNYRIGENGCFETYGEGWTAWQSAGIAFEKDTRHIVYNTSDLGINTSGLRSTGQPRTLIAPNWKDKRLQPGTIVAMRTWHRPTPGIFLNENSQTAIRNVKVHYAEGMGLLAQRCTDISLDKFGVCLRGADDPRYFTTQADATHFSQCKGRITSTRGLYEGMMDDAINIHGVYLKVRERIDDHTLRCRFEHGQAWGFAWGDAGDSVSFVRSLTMDLVGETNTIASIRPADKEKICGAREFIIRFRQPVPEEIDPEQGFGIENLTWTPEVLFSRNIIRNNRARGALFSSPRRTICEKNLFDHTSGTAILLCGDCNGWYESGAVRDLVIRKNKFINALTNMFQFTNAVISIYPEIPALKQQKGFFHGGRPGAIVIEDNEFDTFDAPLLYAKSTAGLTFRNNKIKKNTEYKPFHWNQKPVLLERVTDSYTPGYSGLSKAMRPN